MTISPGRGFNHCSSRLRSRISPPVRFIRFHPNYHWPCDKHVARDGRGSRAAIINNPIPSFLMVMTDASSSDGSAKYVRLVRKVRSILDIGYHGVAESHGRPPGRRVHEKSIRLVQSDMESASAVFQLYSPITVPTKEITKPVGFRSLPFSFLADTVSRNRTFAHHVGFPLAEGLEMIARYLWRHLLRRITCITSKHPRFIT